MFERSVKSLCIVLLLLINNVVPDKLVQAQDINVTVEPSALLENAEVLSLTELGVNTDGSGPVLVSVVIENRSNEPVQNLYLEIVVSSAKEGSLLEYIQQNNRPFSLRAYQSVYITNNDVAKEVFPGISEPVRFSGGLTPQGDDFLNDLSGSTTLPQDTYSLSVSIFTVSDAYGKQVLATDVAEIGIINSSKAAIVDENEIILRTPGDVIGTNSEITNPFPQFSWEGNSNASYRLIVVEENGQDSPEALLQSAKSSPPLSEGGSLLEFENLDMFVQGTSFQFPSSGVQPLEQGKDYFWQVSATTRSSASQNEILSEAWSFTLTDPAGQGTVATLSPDGSISEELRASLIALLGEESFQQIKEQGFTLEAIEYDGQEFTGPAAVVKLEELLQKIRDEEIILQGND